MHSSNNYDAKQDGTYPSSPIPTFFTGSFSGLGNTISRLKIDDTENGDFTGLFAQTGPGGSIAGIGLTALSIQASESSIGGLVCINEGAIANASVTGLIALGANNSTFAAAGLVNSNDGGTIMRSHADVAVTVSGENGAAGLVGGSSGNISQSYATGAVKAGDTGYAGGLISLNEGTITQSYATGSVSGGYESRIGGLISENFAGGTAAQSYSTGKVKGPVPHEGYKGGFVGYDDTEPGSFTSDYWDTTTSHIYGNHGAGNIKHDPGITGLTTEQLQSGLPQGFDPTVWAEDPKINNGFPYLIANPPEK